VRKLLIQNIFEKRFAILIQVVIFQQGWARADAFFEQQWSFLACFWKEYFYKVCWEIFWFAFL